MNVVVSGRGRRGRPTVVTVVTAATSNSGDRRNPGQSVVASAVGRYRARIALDLFVVVVVFLAPSTF